MSFSANDSKANEADSIEGVEQQILAAEQRLQKLDAEIAENKAVRKKLQNSLATVESSVTERAQRIESLNSDIARFSDKLAILEARVTEEQSTVEARKKLLAASLRKTHNIRTGIGLKILLQHDDPALADRLSVYGDYLWEAQKQAIERQITELEKIESAYKITLKDRNWLNFIKNKAAKQHEGFVARRVEGKRRIGEVESTLSKQNRTVAELKADQERLQQVMEELKAAQSSQSGYFASGKGQYSLPVNGQIVAHFGDTKSVGKISWQGIFVQAKIGKLVRTIADGEVVYSDWLQGFGMLVIVDHGDGFMTLYGGNREVMLPKGTWVDSGATIATVGDSGGQSESGLYFEIRQNAKPVDPEQWIRGENGDMSTRK